MFPAHRAEKKRNRSCAPRVFIRRPLFKAIRLNDHTTRATPLRELILFSLVVWVPLILVVYVTTTDIGSV